MPEIVYVGWFKFPEGDAGAVRVLGIAKTLRHVGYAVRFVGLEDGGRPQDLNEAGEFRFEGFQYFPGRDYLNRYGGRIRRFISSYVTGSSIFRRATRAVTKETEIIIAYNPDSILTLRLHRFCRESGIRFIVDCTEWHNSHQFLGGALGWFQWDHALTMRYLNKRADGVIAISSYLRDYYEASGCAVVVIPPLVDLDERKWRSLAPLKNHDNLVLAYAGSPLKKDLLGTILLAVAGMRQEGGRVLLRLVGPSIPDIERELRKQKISWTAIQDCIVAFGHVAHAEVPNLLAPADFSILARPIARYARAGFPTKFVESLAAGVPVITNSTSDILKYTSDGKEILLLKDHTVDSLKHGIRRAAMLRSRERLAMREYARSRALESFDYRAYAAPLKDFLANLKTR